MLCPGCRRQVGRGAPYCPTCGRPIATADVPLELVLADETRVPLVEPVTLGRAPGNTIQLDDRSVSRNHARIVSDGGGARVEDLGSSHGTYVNGQRVNGPRPLADGATLQLGGLQLRIERRRDEAEAGKTIVVRPGATLLVTPVGKTEVEANATSYGFKPRLRSGWAMKRLDESEGPKRWVLKDLRSGKFVRMGADEAALFELIDGKRALPELIGEAERRFGPAGPSGLARLLADLGERGFLAGVEAREEQDAPRGRLAHLFRPRELAVEGVGPFFDGAYRRGGWVLFTRPALVLMAALAVLGLGLFTYLIVGRYGTPFVVGEKIGIGGLVFLLGRFVVVAVHELAHGLTASSYGRQISRAGVKLLLIFPFAFVDTTDAWFEPRRRRIAISGAGPASDLVVGGVFSLCAFALGSGNTRDIFFQLALAAYFGAFSNLNPLLDRDGYHMLVDVLREPGLRRRSKELVAGMLSGKRSGEGQPRTLKLYGVAGLAWSIVAVGFVILLTTRYYGRLVLLASPKVVWAVLGTFYLLMFVPVIVMIGRPLAERWRPKKDGAEHAAA